jgi:frataxin
MSINNIQFATPLGCASQRLITRSYLDSSSNSLLSFKTNYTTQSKSQTGSGALVDAHTFGEAAEETLLGIQETLETALEDNSEAQLDEFDMQYSDGVLTVKLGSKGTYVINKQGPNRQIWLSSPISGPNRYDYVDGKTWTSTRDKHSLHDRLFQEIKQLCGVQIE